MRISDFNLIKTKNEIELIRSDIDVLNSKFSELVDCLQQKEASISEAIDRSKLADNETANLLKEQKEAIAKLEALNIEKQSKLTGMNKWVNLAVLGVLSLTVVYGFEYDKGNGLIIRPHTNTSPILPAVYTVAIVATVTGHDNRLGEIIDKVGGKFFG